MKIRCRYPIAEKGLVLAEAETEAAAVAGAVGSTLAVATVANCCRVLSKTAPCACPNTFGLGINRQSPEILLLGPNFANFGSHGLVTAKGRAPTVGARGTWPSCATPLKTTSGQLVTAEEDGTAPAYHTHSRLALCLNRKMHSAYSKSQSSAPALSVAHSTHSTGVIGRESKNDSCPAQCQCASAPRRTADIAVGRSLGSCPEFPRRRCLAPRA